MSVRIDNVRLWDESGLQGETTSVLVENGMITALGRDLNSSDVLHVDRRIDGRGHRLLPGLTDLACHLREPGPDRKGSIATETRAAAHGGFTTVCTSPDSSPVNDSGAVTHLILDLAARQGAVRVLPVGALTRGLGGELLSDMVGLVGSGCVALSQGIHGVRDARTLRRCMAYARTFDIALFLQAENKALAGEGCAHEGLMSTRLGLPGIPEVAETVAVSEMILLAEETGVRLHLAQLSTGRAVALVRTAQARGVQVTADVSISHLAYNDNRLQNYDSRFHLRPPLRSESDRQALCEGVNDGTLCAIVSQHQPHESEAKQAPFGETEPGLSTVEITLSLGLRLVQQGDLQEQALLRALTSGPAAVLRRDAPAILVGQAADLCLLDVASDWRVSPQTLLSRGKHSPALGESVPGLVCLTWLQGAMTYAAAGWEDAAEDRSRTL